MNIDTTNLLKRGNNYSVRYIVPSELRGVIGRREIVRSLGTSCVRTAAKLRGDVLREIEAELVECQKPKPKAAMRGQREPGKALSSTPSRMPRVSEAAHEWLTMCDGITQGTRATYRRTLDVLEAFTGDAPVTNLNRQTALAFMNHLRTTPSERTGKLRSPRTVAARTLILSSFWKVCKHLGYVDQDMANPFNGVTSHIPGKKRVKQTTKHLRPVTRDEALRLLEAIRRGNDRLKYAYEMEVITRLLWATGCRLNELCSLSTPE